jgi:NADPH:quinone reductase-like Zn-dependent oxidoreductase
MQAVVFDRVATAADGYSALELREVPRPKPGPGEVLVKLALASINPGDFLFVSELYPAPRKPVYPQIAGTHGAGHVVECGAGVTIAPGTLVYFGYRPAWTDYTVLPADELVVLPPDYPLEKAAQFLNQITAWDLLDRSRVQKGQFLALTGGNSSVAMMVTQLAQRRGVRVISIVRKAQHDLRALGAEAVLEHGDMLLPQLDAIVGDAGLHGVIDCVGGPLLRDLFKRIAMHGRAIIYGGYDSAPFDLHNFDVLLRGAAIEAYIYRYFFEAPGPQDRALLDEIAAATAGDDFVVPVGGRHALSDFRRAIDATLAAPERGKQFLVLE